MIHLNLKTSQKCCTLLHAFKPFSWHFHWRECHLSICLCAHVFSQTLRLIHGSYVFSHHLWLIHSSRSDNATDSRNVCIQSERGTHNASRKVYVFSHTLRLIHDSFVFSQTLWLIHDSYVFSHTL